MDLFPQKSPKISGFFAKNDLQLRGSYESSRPCKYNTNGILDFWEYYVQPIADRVAQNLEIISETFSTNQNSVHGMYD